MQGETLPSVSVIGLGYIGLPTAAVIARAGMHVHGVDVSQAVVDTINRGEIHIEEVDLDGLVQGVVQRGLLRAGTEVEPADVFLIAVPTPFHKDGEHTPDVSYVLAAAESVAKVLKAGDTIILESTSPVGTTEQLRDAIAAARPDLALPGLDGKEHRLSDFHGRRVLLNFWASWCGPCLDEMPALARAQAKFGEQGAIVVGIAMDEPARARQFLAAHPVGYPILLGRLDSPSTSLRLGNVGEVLPYSVLLDGNGRILDARRGALDAATLEHWLAPPAAP